MTRKLCVSFDEAHKAKTQHKKPCGDCPWRRDSLAGWLGSGDVNEWLQIAHSDAKVECHTLLGAQCAGIAIYRRNTFKMAYPPNIVLDRDEIAVFSNRKEFAEHHSKAPAKQ